MTFGDGMTPFGGVFVLLWLAVSIGFIVLVAWLVAVVVRSVFRDGTGRYDEREMVGRGGGRGPDDPLEILRVRYARGEITQQEFEEAKRILGY